MAIEVDIDLQYAVESRSLPTAEQFQLWLIQAAQQLALTKIELVIRLVDKMEMIALNHQYRGKNKATNVLSFPFESPPGLPYENYYLGDIIICDSVVEEEAHQQQKLLLAHWAHMTVHGFLHLLGYDHIEEKQAFKMEQKEIEILSALGFNNPYQEIID